MRIQVKGRKFLVLHVDGTCYSEIWEGQRSVAILILSYCESRSQVRASIELNIINKGL